MIKAIITPIGLGSTLEKWEGYIPGVPNIGDSINLPLSPPLDEVAYIIKYIHHDVVNNCIRIGVI